jgi:branched-chain amino acid transport system permease protein
VTIPTDADITKILVLVLVVYAMALPLRVGLFSLAPAAFTGIGGYVCALFVIHDKTTLVAGMVMATAACGVAGALLAVPLVRVQGVYTAVVTLAFVVIATGVETSLRVTGGSLGLVGVPHRDLRLVLYVAIGLTLAFAFWLDRSAFGRRLDLVGHDPLLAATLGINVWLVRLGVLTGSSALAGFAGALYAHSSYFIYPQSFNFYFALLIAVYVVVGGVTHWIGPLVGVVVLAGFKASIPDYGIWADVVSGLLMLVVVVVYPAGVAGALRHHLRGRVFRATRPAPALAAPQESA